MHRIRFRLGLRPRPRRGSLYSAPPDPLAGFKGASSKCGPHDFNPPPSQKKFPRACTPLSVSVSLYSSVPGPGFNFLVSKKKMTVQ